MITTEQIKEFVDNYFSTLPNIIPNVLYYEDIKIYLKCEFTHCYKENEEYTTDYKIVAVYVDYRNNYIHISNYKPVKGIIAIDQDYGGAINTHIMTMYDFGKNYVFNVTLKNYNFPDFPVKLDNDVTKHAYCIIGHSDTTYPETKVVKVCRNSFQADDICKELNRYAHEKMAWIDDTYETILRKYDAIGHEVKYGEIYLDVISKCDTIEEVRERLETVLKTESVLSMEEMDNLIDQEVTLWREQHPFVTEAIESTYNYYVATVPFIEDNYN